MAEDRGVWANPALNDKIMRTAKQENVHLSALERQRVALELRKQGFTYEEIGTHLGVTRQAAHQMVKRAIKVISEEVHETADDVLQIELQRLDRMLIRLWRQAFPKDENAEVNHRIVETMLKIMDRRAKYLGLDAATKHEVLTLDNIDNQIKKLESELAQE